MSSQEAIRHRQEEGVDAAREGFINELAEIISHQVGHRMLAGSGN